MRAVVGESWAVLRSGVAAVLAQAGVEVVGLASTGRELLALVARVEAEVLVVGLLPDLTPTTAVAAALATRPSLHALALLDSADRAALMGVLEAGSVAVIARSAPETELRDGVVRTCRGERFLGPSLLAAAFGAVEPAAGSLLTARERTVLAELARGRSNREIAAALYIGEATVKTHLAHIYEKLEVRNRVQAVGAARSRNLV